MSKVFDLKSPAHSYLRSYYCDRKNKSFKQIKAILCNYALLQWPKYGMSEL